MPLDISCPTVLINLVLLDADRRRREDELDTTETCKERKLAQVIEETKRSLQVLLRKRRAVRARFVTGEQCFDTSLSTFYELVDRVDRMYEDEKEIVMSNSRNIVALIAHGRQAEEMSYTEFTALQSELDKTFQRLSDVGTLRDLAEEVHSQLEILSRQTQCHLAQSEELASGYMKVADAIQGLADRVQQFDGDTTSDSVKSDDIAGNPADANQHQDECQRAEGRTSSNHNADAADSPPHVRRSSLRTPIVRFVDPPSSL
ncbi:hypothetical protein OBBRIDRAFT_889287 [Obba rivulosa]|uniref:Uncharacterized protein n=1 Tax=Obba rivulosa TaxID=1052685 RepID=A0A8E2DJU3_9APHY|nr:hypothetical protein OBBRIDRAFT_889287 [Obba rivulosa]